MIVLVFIIIENKKIVRSSIIKKIKIYLILCMSSFILKIFIEATPFYLMNMLMLDLICFIIWGIS